jgi:undecaprenyl-diphosphatase
MKENVIKFIKNNWRWMLLFICLIGFLALAEDVFHQEIMNGDIVGYDIVSKLFKFNVSTPIAKFITNFGGAIFVISLTTILFFVIKDKKIGISIITNLGIVTILNQIIKFIMQRPRPTEFRIIEETGYSFPSGHSMVSLAFYGYLIYLIYKYINNKHLKRTLIIILSVLICIIGVSRIYLGVHYTSDVLGGFLISFAYLIIYIELVNKFVLEKNKDDRKE